MGFGALALLACEIKSTRQMLINPSLSVAVKAKRLGIESGLQQNPSSVA
jgi:uncharacterized protein YunC (DUF1805 family)